MKSTILAALLGLLSGCAGAAYTTRGVANGFIYADTKAGEQASSNSAGPKTGEVCSSSILGLVTTGDTSYLTAAKNGGIKKIFTVENRYQNILGVYATYCVVVTGE
jgi:hypothetical protein